MLDRFVSLMEVGPSLGADNAKQIALVWYNTQLAVLRGLSLAYAKFTFAWWVLLMSLFLFLFVVLSHFCTGQVSAACATIVQSSIRKPRCILSCI